jgi:hypothetical protein
VIEHAHHRPGVVAVPSLLLLGRRAIPQAFEAAIVPSALFIVVARYAGDNAGIGAALGFAVAAILWRFATARRVPGMMVLAIVTLVVRSVLAFVSGSTFLYSLQPSVGGCYLAAAFLVSVSLDRPLARRFAGDFCALPGDVLAEDHVHRFFCRISVMWGAPDRRRWSLKTRPPLPTLERTWLHETTSSPEPLLTSPTPWWPTSTSSSSSRC